MAAWWSKMGRRPWGVLGVVVVLLAVGGGTWWFLQRDSGTAAAATTTTTTRDVAAVLSTITSQVSASGTVTPAVQDEVSFGASGRVTAVKVAAGQSVTRGQVLATIDTVSLKAALASAKATLASAQAKLTAAHSSLTTARTAVTTDQTAVTTAQTAVTTAAGTSDTADDTTAAAGLTAATTALTNAKAQVPAAQAQVSADQAQVTSAATGVTTAATALDSSTLRSPITGLVATVGVAVGDSVSGTTATASTGTSGSSAGSGSGAGAAGSGGGTGAGSGSGSSGGPAITSTSSAPFLVVSTASWVANVTVDDSSINLIKKGIQARLAVGSSTTPIFGTVSSVGLISTSTGSTASYPVVVAVTGRPTGLHDGASATVSLIYRQLSNVLTVPTAAIHTTSTGKVVYRSVNGQQVSTVVTTGEVGDGVTQILTGLTEGDEVQVTSTTGNRTGTGIRTGTGGYGGGFPGGAGGYGVGGGTGRGTGGYTGGQNGGGFTGGRNGGFSRTGTGG